MNGVGHNTKQNVKQNNRGSAMVMLIIAFALVSILVAVIMIMTTLNLQMKYTERQAKKNFYTAEIAMEEIRAGLELEVSKAAETAFNSIQHVYAMLTESERVTNFRINYINTLRESLKDGTDKIYDLSILKGYVDETQFAGGKFDIVSTSGCKMEGLSKGLVLRGVKVEYTDEQGYLSIVETDFVLTIPDLQFTQSAVMPDIFSYSLVADTGIKGNATGVVNFEDGVYAGTNGIEVTGASSNWKFGNMNRLICKESMTAAQRAEITVNPEVNFWVGDILADSAKISLLGRSYVAEDTSIRGKNGVITIWNEYYGYGNGTELKMDGSFAANKDRSSAMIINGLNSTLDMTKLNKLVLSGRASISTGIKEITPPKEDGSQTGGIKPDKNENIPMSGTIEIKSNQIAYLVPPECIGVSGGTALIGKNPMSEQDYIRLVEYKNDKGKYPDFQEVSLNVTMEKMGKTLNDYNAGNSLKFQKIFQQVNGGVVVFYYLILDEKNAVDYFADYYKAEQKKLDSYMKKYTNNLMMNDKISRLVLGGNSFTYDGKNITLHKQNNSLTAEEIAGLREEQDSYAKIFAALNSKLLANYSDLSTSEKQKTVFENLVRTEAITGVKTYELNLDGDSRKIRAVVTNGDFKYTETEKNKNYCLVIAKGNVSVEADFSGLILAGGTVTVKNVGTIKGNKEDLIKMLQCPIEEPDGTKTTLIEKYFRNGSSYVLEGTVIDKKDAVNENYLNMTDYVQYENWKKQ